METAWWQRLRGLADRHGDYNQQDIAARLGVSNAAVTGWKQGTLPTWQNILKAAHAYGTDAHELLITAIPEFAPQRVNASLLGIFSHQDSGA